MAKPRLKTTAAAATEGWVKARKAAARQVGGDKDKVQMTIYLSPDVHKLLWHRRLETGIPVTRSIEAAVVKVFGIRKG